MHATDNSCIVFEVRDQEMTPTSGPSTQRIISPLGSDFKMYDPQAAETHVNNQKSFDRLYLKLAMIEQ